jgi:hypothetical protein
MTLPAKPESGAWFLLTGMGSQVLAGVVIHAIT